MSRAHLREQVLAVGAGQVVRAVAGATVYVYDQGTTNPISATLYAGASGTSALSNPLTASASGVVEFWLDTPATVTLSVSKQGYVSHSYDAEVTYPQSDVLTPAEGDAAYDPLGTASTLVTAHTGDTTDAHAQSAIAGDASESATDPGTTNSLLDNLKRIRAAIKAGLGTATWSGAVTRTLEAVNTLLGSHVHDGSDGTVKLSQANTHQSADTDAATSSLHHTIGTSATQAAAGNHAHAGTYEPSGTVSAHEADTTNIHGIADTSVLATRTGIETLTNKTLTTPTLTLKQSAGAAPTAAGEIQYDTTAKLVKVGDGSAARILGDKLLDRNTTPTTCAVNSETSVYSFSIPAGAMGTNRAIRLTFFGTYLNNNSATADLFFNAYFSGNRILSGMAENITTSASRRGVKGTVIIGNNASASSQHASLSVMLSGPAAMNNVSGSGISEAAAGSTGAMQLEVVNTGLAVDTGSAQTLELKVRHDATNANQTITIYECWLELL